MQTHDFGHIGETYLRSEFDVTHNLLSTSCQSFQRQIDGKLRRRFRDVFEPTQTIGDVRLGRDTFEAVCNASSVMPRPMSRNEAIKWLVLTDTLDQRPGLEEVNERLVGGEDFDQRGRQPALEVGRTLYITLVETHGGPSILDMCSVS